ncbi:extracellular solute-binding protein [Paenibacillus eucommiae]|uniref:Multiple sugar transport system substrate-binding protein n=1 Tax=Paenibacillus eucommiae TaxID=1355755 RepID=A0ABS4JAK3_9BACL|nr:extracellular solute-binding protein [Paenibacillus eucommiae]MBP1996872.1 multiple sugar transport system substrate-binding protein [Paenibacillus eucommiae]
MNIIRRENDYLYVKLYNTLKEQIVTGFIKPGGYLLAESELCTHYSMSRNSVRKALEQLHKEGLVVKRVGLGTMVPEDLVVTKSDRKTLRIFTPFPAHFVDYGFQFILDAFQRSYPQVDVKLLSFPVSKFWESIRLSSELGFAPDIVLASDLQLLDRSKLASFIDLSQDEELAGELSSIYPKVLHAFREANECKAAPISFTPVYLTYNPGLFTAGGVTHPALDWTLDDFIDAAQRLTLVQSGTKDGTKDGRIHRYGFSISPDLNRWPVFALQNGFHSPDQQLRQSSIRQAFALIEKLCFNERIALAYPGIVSGTNPFVYEKSAMTLTTLFEMASWKEQNISFEPEVAPLPFGNERTSLMQANALMISASCSDMSLARAFIRTALSSSVQQEMCEGTPFLSIKKAINESTKSKAFLQSLHIDGELIDNNVFMRELFQESDRYELQSELGLFWLGLDSAGNAADAVEHILMKD